MQTAGALWDVDVVGYVVVGYHWAVPIVQGFLIPFEVHCSVIFVSLLVVEEVDVVKSGCLNERSPSQLEVEESRISASLWRSLLVGVGGPKVLFELGMVR